MGSGEQTQVIWHDSLHLLSHLVYLSCFYCRWHLCSVEHAYVWTPVYVCVYVGDVEHVQVHWRSMYLSVCECLL